MIQPDDPTITQLLATHYDCSKQYNLRQFSLTRVQKCTQTDSEIEYTRTYALVVNRPKAKKLKIFRRSATIQKTRVFCAQGAQDNYYRHYRMDWHTNSMQLPKERDYNECDNFIRNLISTDSAELNQKFLNRNVTCFHRMRFQIQIEKKRTPFTVTVLDTVHTGVFTYQPKSYDWITSTANSKSRCKDDQENFFDKDSWLLITEEISVGCDDKLDKLILEAPTLPCLHSECFCKPTLKHLYSIVWFPEEIDFIYHISDFIGRMSNLKKSLLVRNSNFLRQYWKEHCKN